MDKTGTKRDQVMRRLLRLALVPFALGLVSLAPAFAAPATLSPAMQPLAFLIGHWTATDGRAENKVIAKGVSNIEPAAEGAALLRRDRTDLFSSDGKPLQSFEQVMLIYPEGGALHGDYFDGTHVIHYVSATVDPGKSVTFLTAATPGPPRFRLTYTARGPDGFNVKFEMAPPGASDFTVIASGDAKRD
jgi:hypothetical protein